MRHGAAGVHSGPVHSGAARCTAARVRSGPVHQRPGPQRHRYRPRLAAAPVTAPRGAPTARGKRTFEIREVVRRWAPALITLSERPYWICLYDSPAGSDAPAAPPLEFWVGVGFDDWHPREGCLVIIAVMSTTSIAGGASPAQQRLVCAVSEDGQAYAATTSATKDRLVAGVPHSGRLLDAIRSKFGLPPGPPAPTTWK